MQVTGLSSNGPMRKKIQACMVAKASKPDPGHGGPSWLHISANIAHNVASSDDAANLTTCKTATSLHRRNCQHRFPIPHSRTAPPCQPHYSSNTTTVFLQLPGVLVPSPAKFCQTQTCPSLCHILFHRCHIVFFGNPTAPYTL